MRREIKQERKQRINNTWQLHKAKLAWKGLQGGEQHCLGVSQQDRETYGME